MIEDATRATGADTVRATATTGAATARATRATGAAIAAATVTTGALSGGVCGEAAKGKGQGHTVKLVTPGIPTRGGKVEK